MLSFRLRLLLLLAVLPAGSSLAGNTVPLSLVSATARDSAVDIATGDGTLVRELKPLELGEDRTRQTLASDPGEHFFGGGRRRTRIRLKRFGFDVRRPVRGAASCNLGHAGA